MKNFLSIIFCLSLLCMSIGASCSTCVIEKTSNRDLSTSYCKDADVQNICTLQSGLYITKDIVLCNTSEAFNAGHKPVDAYIKIKGRK